MVGRDDAEAVNPTREEAYWREKHSAQAFANKKYSFEHYARVSNGLRGGDQIPRQKVRRDRGRSRAWLWAQSRRLAIAVGPGAACHAGGLDEGEWHRHAARHGARNSKRFL